MTSTNRPWVPEPAPEMHMSHTGKQLNVSSQQPLLSRASQQMEKTATANAWVWLQEPPDTLPSILHIHALMRRPWSRTFIPWPPYTCNITKAIVKQQQSQEINRTQPQWARSAKCALQVEPLSADHRGRAGHRQTFCYVVVCNPCSCSPLQTSSPPQTPWRVLWHQF